jgi:hypothetical protein
VELVEDETHVAEGWGVDLHCSAPWEGRKGRTPFLKKRSKKLLLLARVRFEAMAGRVGSAKDIKVFWFFSSEKNCFLA